MAEPRASPLSLSGPILLSLEHWQPSQTRLRPPGAAPGLGVGGLLGEAATGDRRGPEKTETGGGGQSWSALSGGWSSSPRTPLGNGGQWAFSSLGLGGGIWQQRSPHRREL